MNLKWIIIGGMLLILLVAFGRNPVEDMRERRAKRLEGKDPLVLSIEEHNKQGRTGFGGFNTSAPQTRNLRNTPYQRNTPGYNPAAPTTQQPQLQPQTPPPQNNNYYPPTPGSPGSFNNAPVRADSPFVLADGRKLTFYGTQAFTQDESGNKIPLPDGKHPIFGGRALVVIKNGAKVAIISNTGS